LDRALGEPHSDRIEPVWLDGPEQHPDENLVDRQAIREWTKHASSDVEVAGGIGRFEIDRERG